MSKWDIPKHRKQRAKPKIKPEPYVEICRILPPVLARIGEPSIEWLMQYRRVKFDMYINSLYNSRVREISELIKNSNCIDALEEI